MVLHIAKINLIIINWWNNIGIGKVALTKKYNDLIDRYLNDELNESDKETLDKVIEIIKYVIEKVPKNTWWKDMLG